MKIKIKTEKVISVQDWDEFVEETYKRPYNFQQQNDCQSRGTYRFEVPDKYAEDFDRDTIPEIVNHDDMGVSFAAWLKRDPKQKLAGGNDRGGLQLWWERNFYPTIEMVANDLHAKGLLESGEYTIDIDW